jgi:hypothetical protein
MSQKTSQLHRIPKCKFGENQISPPCLIEVKFGEDDSQKIEVGHFFVEEIWGPKTIAEKALTKQLGEKEISRTEFRGNNTTIVLFFF